MSTNVVMPQLGESVVEGTIGKWLKQIGDPIEQYEPIMEVITDKVTTEIPSPAAGTLLQILVPEGTTVKAGTVLALIGAKGEQAAASPVPVYAATAATPTAPSPAGARNGEHEHNGHGARRLTPVVARMIAEHHISDAELGTIRDLVREAASRKKTSKRSSPGAARRRRSPRPPQTFRRGNNPAPASCSGRRKRSLAHPPLLRGRRNRRPPSKRRRPRRARETLSRSLRCAKRSPITWSAPRRSPRT
jgi:pyruvate/2-oxoglutarate dehydrogenase complex dihydrolipoamide acyltransferase (E2) component